MDKLIKSTEQLALTLAIGILCISGLSFSLSHQLGQAHQLRFLFSGAVLGLAVLLLRFGFQVVQPLHKASYRLAVVMMTWSIGFYFFPYPQFILYLVALPALYFLMRVELKGKSAPKEDLIATGILLGLAIFLYLQQQPLQLMLFDNPAVDWKIYYTNAPCMILVGAAFLRYQYWVKWDGLALLGCFILLLSSILSLSLVTHIAWLELKELVYFVLLAHTLLAFVFVSNSLYLKFSKFSGIDMQRLNFPKSVYWMIFGFSQIGVLLVLQLFWTNPIIAKEIYIIWQDSNGNAFWYASLLLSSLLTMVYAYRTWTISLLFVESAIICAIIATKMPFLLFGLEGPVWLCGLLAGALFAMAHIKRQNSMAHTIQLWGFWGVLIVYGFLFLHTPIFTPLGFVGFGLPILAWIYFPDKPTLPIRNLEFYMWPFVVLVTVLCFSPSKDFSILTTWAMITISIPLFISLALTNKAFIEAMEYRDWRRLIRWQRLNGRAMPSYATFTLLICGSSFYFNQDLLINHWHHVLMLWLSIVLCAGGLLRFAIPRQAISEFLFAEIVLWSAMGLIRWKLDVDATLELGSAMDGYIFLGVSILVAGIREKAKQHHSKLSSYFTKTTILYGLLGWLYFIYLYLTGGVAIHSEMASLAIAGIFYWLSRKVSAKLQIFVFIFANIGLFLFFDDINLNNALFYIIPALISALTLTQLFKDDLSATQIKNIRFYCGLILLGVSAAYNMLDFQTSIWLPVTAIMLSSLVVVLGVSLRIRVFLYLGSAFFFINIAGMIVNVIVNQPDGHTMFAVGVLFFVMGILFITSYLLFQMKREEILSRYRNVMETVEAWD